MDPIIRFVRRQPIFVFVLLTFSVSWTLWYFAGAYSEVTIHFKPLGYRWLLAQIGVFSPAVIGGLLSKIISTGKGQQQGRAWLIYIAALLLGLFMSFSGYEDVFRSNWLGLGLILLAIISMVVFTGYKTGVMVEMFTTSKKNLIWVCASVCVFPLLMVVSMLGTRGKITIMQAYVAGDSISNLVIYAAVLFAFNLVFGGSLGEEPGWRGFALPVLLKKYSPVRASVILGVYWALFHAPIDVSHGFMLNGWGAVLARIAWTIPLTLTFTAFSLKTNGCVLVAILLHTTLNFSFDFFQPSNGTVGVFSAGMIILGILLSFLGPPFPSSDVNRPASTLE